MPFDSHVLDALQGFLDDGLIDEVLYEVKSGKEATVFCCRSGTGLQPSRNGTPPPLLAAKVYRPLESRSFRNDAVYQTGRVHVARNSRVKRAAQSGSAFGREIQYGTWIDQEWQIMQLLHDCGADVVSPIARSDRAILMPFLGDHDAAAPKLVEANLPRSRVLQVADRLLWNIELMLDRHVVHGDLSPFNILWWQDRAVIIDFPQATDPRLNPAAENLLRRDVANVCGWAGKHGVSINATRFSDDLWSRFVIGEIG